MQFIRANDKTALGF